jgi:hypothetical protein
MFNMILSRDLHVSLITNATNTFFESKISVVNRYASLATASPLDDMSLHHKFINSALGIHCHRMRYIHFSMELLENDFSFQFKCPKLLAKVFQFL